MINPSDHLGVHYFLAKFGPLGYYILWCLFTMAPPSSSDNFLGSYSMQNMDPGSILYSVRDLFTMTPPFWRVHISLTKYESRGLYFAVSIYNIIHSDTLAVLRARVEKQKLALQSIAPRI